MAYLGNVPTNSTLIRVEARKSFSLAVWVMDPRGKAVNLTDCAMTIVVKPQLFTDATDLTNMLAIDSAAIISAPTLGYARFDVQASTLNHDPGEYDFAIVLRTADGYSSVIVKGTFDIQQNTEFDSIGTAFTSANPSQALTVQLRESNTINVYVGSQLPPGMNYVRDDVMAAIENFDPDAIALVPTEGDPGYVLTKLTGGDYDMAWRPGAQGTLDATGQPAGRVPTAVGDDTWTWDDLGIDATGITAGWAPVANGDDTWGWAEVDTAQPDWAAGVGAPGEILNKPELGSAAAADETDFVAATALMSSMEGVHIQTTIPVTGVDGHFYFVYEP